MKTQNKVAGEWPFNDEPRVAVFTTTQVLPDGKPTFTCHMMLMTAAGS